MKTINQKDVYLFSLINPLGVNAKEGKHRKVTNKMLHRIYFSDVVTVWTCSVTVWTRYNIDGMDMLCYGMEKI